MPSRTPWPRRESEPDNGPVEPTFTGSAAMACVGATTPAAKASAAAAAEAAASFNRRGYHGTSLTEIAKKLGVTKAALYTYVPSKEELLYYCHDAAMDSAIESLHKAQASAGNGLERLTLTLRHYLEMMLG